MNGLKDTGGVGGAILQRSVSVDGADTEEVQVRMVRGEENGEDVLGRRSASLREWCS